MTVTVNELNELRVIRPKKKISGFRVTGLKILGRVGTHIFSIIFFLEKNIILCLLKGILPFKMREFFLFPRKLEKILGLNFHQ